MSLNLTIERQIAKNTVAGAGYLGSLGRHLAGFPNTSGTDAWFTNAK